MAFPPAERGGIATRASSSTCSGIGPEASATTNSTWTEPPTTRASVWLISGRYRLSSQSRAKPLGAEMRYRLSSISTSSVSLSQVSKFAGDSETCSSPRAARHTCFASINRALSGTVRGARRMGLNVQPTRSVEKWGAFGSGVGGRATIAAAHSGGQWMARKGRRIRRAAVRGGQPRGLHRAGPGAALAATTRRRWADSCRQVGIAGRQRPAPVPWSPLVPWDAYQGRGPPAGRWTRALRPVTARCDDAARRLTRHASRR